MEFIQITPLHHFILSYHTTEKCGIFTKMKFFDVDMSFDDTTKKQKYHVKYFIPLPSINVLLYNTMECLRVLLNGLKGFSSVTAR